MHNPEWDIQPFRIPIAGTMPSSAHISSLAQTVNAERTCWSGGTHVGGRSLLRSSPAGSTRAGTVECQVDPDR